MKFYNPSDQFKDVKLTIVEIFLWATNSVWQNFLNDDQNVLVDIWLKFALCHTFAARKLCFSGIAD